jgi:hypothetical protein
MKGKKSHFESETTAVDDDRRAGTGQPFRGGSGDDRLAALEFDIHAVSFQLLRRQQVRERLSLWKARKC